MSAATWFGWGLAAAGGAGLLLYIRRAAQSGAPADSATALARVIASEVGPGTSAERAAIGWSVRNRAERRGVDVVRLVCSPACGPQWEGGGRIRPFSSAQAPAADDARLAASILAAPHASDPTGGAISFIEPELQDRPAASGRLGYRHSYDEIRKLWIADGQHPIGRVGRFELWTR